MCWLGCVVGGGKRMACYSRYVQRFKIVEWVGGQKILRRIGKSVAEPRSGG